MVLDATMSADASQVAYTLRAPAPDADAFTAQVFVMPASGGEAVAVGNGRRPAFAPKGTALARLVQRDGRTILVVRDAPQSPDRSLSSPTQHVAAYRWSPDGTRLVFAAETIESVGGARRFGSGDPGQRQALYLVDAAGGEPRRITPNGFAIGPAAPELPDLIEFDWLGNERLIVSGRAPDNTEGLHAASLHIAEVASGRMQYLTGTGGRWHQPVVSPNGEWIAFTGQPLGPVGWMASELIVVRPNGTGLRRLTVGLDRDVLDVAWASDSRTIWFATEERGSRNLMRVDSRNGRIAAGTSGTHLLMLEGLSRRGDWALAVRSTAASAGALIRFPLAKPHEFTTLHEPPPAEVAGETEELDLRTADGVSLHGWLHRPPDFDPSRRYPLLVEVHGGPHAMAGAGYAPSALWHAAAGWLVVRLNPRGSAGFGFDLVNGLATRWPEKDVEDVRAAITALVERGLVDSNRVAVAGTGAGAAVALALRAFDMRIRTTILRCADGNWLSGGAGVDPSPWREWHASRPFPQSAGEWWRTFATILARPAHSPLLVIEGTAGEPQAIALSDAVAAANGTASKFIRVPGRCRETGPATQQGLYEEEREFLTSRTSPDT